MILKKEIQNKSVEWKVPPDTVDKDWVLGHFLAAMFSTKKHSDGLVFKGGTALRKCYFEQYRFSEDLDFTAIDPNYVISISGIEEIIQILKNSSGILFHIESYKQLEYEDQLTGYQVKMKYWGANHPKSQDPPAYDRWTTGIKLEIILYEKLVFKPVQKKIIHVFSDELYKIDLKIPCYDLKEVMAEKLRALVQRSYTAPRDFFDIFYLNRYFTDDDWVQIKSAFIMKAEYKGYRIVDIKDVFNGSTMKNLKNAWENSLKHQMSEEVLPDADTVIIEVKGIIEKYITGQSI